MEINQATQALAALGHATRLSVFRLLVQAGRDGLLAGEIAQRLGLPGATLSFHLKELSAAGLVGGQARGRTICYRADFDGMNALLGFLTHNCCNGEADCLPDAAPPAASRAPRNVTGRPRRS
ncbi:helix-turn-helix transcriptional regulator [Xanthomonas sp. AmX2]|uniref:ArsR/SmtB family transcription factor n=1 Tax=Xanthomonas sp. TaxID=29446 RepID=UPI00197DC1D0|nr:metalloregulator ArsR/SmtB family transcription factor [Xanthomonas sp.]MBN6151546.1 helix-turn-helix transcriptional regulator [Xanthomonas sp.]